MNNKINWKSVPLEAELDGIKLKGELRYWSKDWEIILQEPIKASCSGHLQYAVPVKYVIEYSKNPTSKEINILENSKDTLLKLYLENK